MAILDNEIKIFPGINDLQIPPSPTKGCNGGYFIEKFNQLLYEIESEIEILSNRITGLSSTLNAKITASEAKITANTSDITALKSRPLAVDYSSQISAANTEINTLKTEISTLKAQVSQLQSSGNLGGGTNPPPSDPLLLPDTFDAPNGTTLLGKYSVTNGPKWLKLTANSADGIIENNAIKNTGSRLQVKRDAGKTTYAYSAKLLPLEVNPDNAIQFWFRVNLGAIEQGILAQFHVGNLTFYRWDGGEAVTALRTVNYVTLSANYDTDFLFRVNEARIEAYLNGSLLDTLVNSDFSSNTAIGIGLIGNKTLIKELSVI